VPNTEARKDLSAANAKSAADDFIAQLQFPQPASRSQLQLVTFESDEDCRFFYPRRALRWQRQVNTYISRALRPKGIRVRRLSVSPSEYDQWRGSRSDTPELRRTFVDQKIRFEALTD
jgi:hypothetical protein